MKVLDKTAFEKVMKDISPIPRLSDRQEFLYASNILLHDDMACSTDGKIMVYRNLSGIIENTGRAAISIDGDNAGRVDENVSQELDKFDWERIIFKDKPKITGTYDFGKHTYQYLTDLGDHAVVIFDGKEVQFLCDDECHTEATYGDLTDNDILHGSSEYPSRFILRMNHWKKLIKLSKVMTLEEYDGRSNRGLTVGNYKVVVNPLPEDFLPERASYLW